MSYLVISTSLNPNSRSRIMAQEAIRQLSAQGVETEWLDLTETTLPLCDAGACYADPNVQKASSMIENAEGIIVATPIYNYSCSASAKNLIELTGQKWTEKIVGFLCAAGGPGSYMAIMGLANHLMLDFRSVIVPRFSYAQGEAFINGEITDDDVRARIENLAIDVIRFHTGITQQD
jgi:FMN reductase